MSGQARARREQARSIWQAGVDAVQPEELVFQALKGLGLQEQSVLVVGAGKAGAGMALGVERFFQGALNRARGWINVPAPPPGEALPKLKRIHLHPARPAGSNHPTAAAVRGSEEMLKFAASAGRDDVMLCLISGGGSALLPAPCPGVSLEDKQEVTKLLHASGATINEMNAVRKHLSRIKGGRLAQAFQGRALFSLILSDVIGDPLDVIASGPTAPDRTTFADALGVLGTFRLLDRVPPAVKVHLERGARGEVEETPKALSGSVRNFVLGNNQAALAAAGKMAEGLGYRVINLGAFIQGETREAAAVLAGVVRSLLRDGQPAPRPVCLLSGGETTVTLGGGPGLGGRNQEMALAILHRLGEELAGVAILCAGTDGEDGPTDAAGAFVDCQTLQLARKLVLDPAEFLARHDAYRFFEKTGDLFKPGPTGTNVMDLRVILAP